jgi:hypothetical protein
MGSALARSQYPSGRYPYFFLDLGETSPGRGAAVLHNDLDLAVCRVRPLDLARNPDALAAFYFVGGFPYRLWHVRTPGPRGGDVIRRPFGLDEILEEFATAVGDGSAISDGVRIDRIARLEKLRAVTAALQAPESVRFAQSQVAEQLAADVHPTAIGRGIAEQIGLAQHRPRIAVRTARHLRSTQ